MKMRLAVACAILAADSCLLAQPVEAEKPLPAHERPIDLTGRRIAGRETQTIEPGVTLHADVKIEAANGVIQLHGKVFLDATGQKPSRGKLPGWPLCAYADSAVWDPAVRQLKLSGSPVLEEAGSATVSDAPHTVIFLMHKSRKILGRTKCIAVENKKSQPKGPVL